MLDAGDLNFEVKWTVGVKFMFFFAPSDKCVSSQVVMIEGSEGRGLIDLTTVRPIALISAISNK